MKARRNPFFFPLAHLSYPVRIFLAILPGLLLMVARQWLPPLANKAPIVFYYPAVLLATWLGGSLAGLVSTIISTLLILFVIRPEIKAHITQDAPTTIRVIMFYLSTCSFLIIVWMLERAVKTAEEAVRLRDEFLTFASHELRTPMTALKLNLEVFKDKLSKKRVAENDLVPIERQLKRQDKLIHSMLDLTLIESGQLGLRKEYCNLSKIVERSIEEAKDTLNENHIQTSLSPVFGHWDRLRMEQAVYNLVHNALRYGDKNSVQVSLQAKGDNAFIEISNKGSAIPEKHRSRIFKKFERPLNSAKVQGLGIGLYLARFMIELHGGKLELSNSNEDSTVFTLILPITHA